MGDILADTTHFFYLVPTHPAKEKNKRRRYFYPKRVKIREKALGNGKNNLFSTPLTKNDFGSV
jgi:hypothetical protein